MNIIENTAKSFGGAIAFTGVAWLSDVIGGALGSFQLNTLGFLFGGPQVLLTAAVAVVLAVVDFITGTDTIAYIAGGFTFFFSLQALLSLLVLCVFYAIVMASPKDTYTTLDCLIAAGVFLLEAAPFLGMFVFWGAFAAYLRRQQIAGVVGKVAQVGGVATKVAGGGVGGGVGNLLRNVGRLFK